MFDGHLWTKRSSVLFIISSIFFIFTDYNIRKRHLFLLDTIGTLDMEDRAYNQALLFCILCPILTITLSILQYFLFNLYNEKYHPFSKILQESKETKNDISQPIGGDINKAFETESDEIPQDDLTRKNQ